MPICDVIMPICDVMMPVCDVIMPICDVILPICDVIMPVRDVMMPGERNFNIKCNMFRIAVCNLSNTTRQTQIKQKSSQIGKCRLVKLCILTTDMSQ